MSAWSPPARYWLSGACSNVKCHPWSTFSIVCSTVFEVKSPTVAFAKMRVVSWIATGPLYTSHVAPSFRL